MSVQKHEPEWWSDIFQTEIRLLQTRDGRHCVMPSESVGCGRVASVRIAVTAFLERVGSFFARRSPTSSAVSCAAPLEAYLHACIAGTFFCYVSPTIYGLTASNDERGVTQVDAHSGDDL